MFKTPWRVVTTFALGLLLLAGGTICAQQFEQTPDDKEAARSLCQMIEANHISQKKIDDEISRKTLKRFIESIDPLKLYFTEADIDIFRESENDLDNQLKEGNVAFAYKVHGVYLNRLQHRLVTIARFIQAEHDFTLDESRIANPDDLTWSKTAKELDERWRKRIKAELLAKKLDDVKLAEARTQLVKRYTNFSRNERQTERSDILQKYLSSMTHCFDPHSSYMSPQTREDFNIAMRLRLQGIGAALGSEDGMTIVRQIVPGGAAHKDGRLKLGDKIIGVGQAKGDIEDIVEMKLSRVVRLIRGKAGTKVRLQVKVAKTGETSVYELTRQLIELKESAVGTKIIETAKRIKGTKDRIGVIRLPSFYRDFDGERRGLPDFRSSARDVRKALEGFTKDGKIGAVVLDLRTNGGGALKDAIEVSGLFIDEGPVVHIKSPDGSVSVLRDQDAGIAWEGPLVVLTSRMSASASEIFAGVIKDYRRGLIIGDETTHGKGTVQNVVQCPRRSALNFFRKPTGALKLTIQQFYRVNGDSSQERGIPSDVILPSVINHMDFGESSLDNHLPFDKIKPADYKTVSLVNDTIVKTLQKKSGQRVTGNADFAKDREAIRKFLIRKKRKTISINEAVLRKELEENKADKEKKPATPEGTPPVFRDDHYNSEVLQITLDYIQQLKQARLVRN